MNKPVPTTPMVFERIDNYYTVNMDHIADQMRAAGFKGRNTALWFTIAFVYNYGPEKDLLNLGDAEMAVLQTQRQQIYDWFDAEVLKVLATMKADPSLRVVAITNDGYDRCGFRLGPPIVSRLSDYSDRVVLGDIFTYDERRIK
jgi:hypothetical protein